MNLNVNSKLKIKGEILQVFNQIKAKIHTNASCPVRKTESGPTTLRWAWA